MRSRRPAQVCATIAGHAAVALVVGAVAAAAPAVAAWLDMATATSSFATDTLLPVTNFAATPSCLVAVRTITLTWTPSSSTYATGYKVMRKVGSGSFVEHDSIVGRLTGTYVDTPLLEATTYTYYVQTVYASWTAASSQQSATTQGPVCI